MAACYCVCVSESLHVWQHDSMSSISVVAMGIRVERAQVRIRLAAEPRLGVGVRPRSVHMQRLGRSQTKLECARTCVSVGHVGCVYV